MQYSFWSFLRIWMSTFGLAGVCWAQQTTLIVQVKDLENRPIQRVEIAVAGTTQSGTTGPIGIAKIKLDPILSENGWITLEVKSLPSKSYVLISPWNSSLQILPVDSQRNNVVTVVLADRGDHALLENPTALATITARIARASSPMTKEIDPEEQGREGLESMAKVFGLAPGDIDSAIRTWGEKAEDPYAQGLVALYERNFALASDRLTETLGALKEDSAKSQVVGQDVAFFLGRSKYEEGKYEEAAAVYRYAQKLRPDDPILLNNLALSTDMSGDHAGAELLYRQMLARDEEILGSNHPDVSRDLGNLASLLRLKGDATAAEPLLRRVLALDEKTFGPDQTKVATDLNNLGAVLQAKGNYAEAETMYWRARAIDERVLGPEHPNVARDLNNLGSVLQAKGDKTEAEAIYRRALEIDEKALGPVHAKVATDLSRLAGLLQANSDLKGAEPLYRRALQIDEKAVGPDHPDVAADLDNLAGLLQAKGDLADAEPLYQKALAIAEKSLGKADPKVRMIRRHLEALPKKKAGKDKLP